MTEVQKDFQSDKGFLKKGFVLVIALSKMRSVYMMQSTCFAFSVFGIKVYTDLLNQYTESFFVFT